MKGYQRLIWIIAVALYTTGVLRAQPPDQDILRGTVVEKATGKPLANARVAVYLDGSELVGKVGTEDDGSFQIALRNPRDLRAWDCYLVLARTETLMAQPVTIAHHFNKPIVLELGEGKVRSVRVITTNGKPVAGATVRLDAFSSESLEYQDEDKGKFALFGIQENINKFFNPIEGRTDGSGIAHLEFMPDSTSYYLSVSHPNYVTISRYIRLLESDTPDFALPRKATIEGRIYFADTSQPLYHPLLQAGYYMQFPQNQWFIAPVQTNGTFKIDDLPWLAPQGIADINQVSFKFGLLMSRSNEITAPNLSLKTINYHSYDILITVNEGERQKWYLAYMEQAEKTIHIKEGEHARRDIALQPLARIQGRVLGLADTTPIKVSYRNPQSSGNLDYFFRDKAVNPFTEADWTVETDAKGDFEIFAPFGDVILIYQFPDGTLRTQLIANLKAHETREVTLSFNPQP